MKILSAFILAAYLGPAGAGVVDVDGRPDRGHISTISSNKKLVL